MEYSAVVERNEEDLPKLTWNNFHDIYSQVKKGKIKEKGGKKIYMYLPFFMYRKRSNET